MTNAPNLDFVPNVEMANAFVNNARNANNRAIKNAAKKAEDNARNEAVRLSRAEATAAKAAARANREKSNRNKAAAKKAAENAEKAKKAKKAVENAEKAKKARLNTVVKNVENKLKVIQNGKEGARVYRAAARNLHPNKATGNTESFKRLGKIYNNFKKRIG